MKLLDIYNYMANGELSQIFTGSNKTAFGDLTDEAYLKLWPNTKLGIDALYRRFKLREVTTTITLVDETLSYPMNQPDFIQIIRVYDDLGCELVMNDLGNEDSLHTPQSNILVIPEDIETATLKVVYRARHPEFNQYTAPSSPGITEVELPETHLLALCYFVASRFLNPMGSTSEGFHDGNNYAALYENECQRLEGHGYQVQQTDSREDIIDARGWA